MKDLVCKDALVIPRSNGLNFTGSFYRRDIGYKYLKNLYDYSNKQNSYYLKYGNIKDKEYSVPLLPVLCKFDYCGCLTDLQTTIEEANNAIQGK